MHNPADRKTCKAAMKAGEMKSVSAIAGLLAATSQLIAHDRDDTTAPARHPAVRLMVCKLCELAGITVEWGEQYAAWVECDQVAGDPRELYSAQ